MDIIHKWKAGLQWKTWKLSMEKCFNTPHGQFSMDSVDKRGHLVRGYCPWKAWTKSTVHGHIPWNSWKYSMDNMEEDYSPVCCGKTGNRPWKLVSILHTENSPWNPSKSMENLLPGCINRKLIPGFNFD